METKKIHFIGCAGVSMSALMALAEKAGFKVSGSDLKIAGHSEDNIKDDLDIVVYTSSITEGSEGYKELKKARELGIKTMPRGQYLATIVNKTKNSVVVSGMHGKTTIATMLGLVLKAAGLKPTVISGTNVSEFGGNYLAGDGEYIVTEGCEYYDSFLHLKPTIAIITNIEAEHLDYFKDLNTIIESFAKFIGNIDPNGYLIYFAEDENINKAIARAVRKPKYLIAYGPGGDKKYLELKYKLNIPGEHNRSNALAVTVASDALLVSAALTKKTLINYRGAGRRMEIKGEVGGVLLVDDYGHHPTEIKKTISALKEFYPDKKIIVAFWPHQYKRIASLFSDFSQSFLEADQVLLLPIYFVPGRDEKLAVSSEDLASAIERNGKSVKVFGSVDIMVKYLQANLSSGDLLLTIGIPPINQVAEKYLKEALR